jgi:hypothetical protein
VEIAFYGFNDLSFKQVEEIYTQYLNQQIDISFGIGCLLWLTIPGYKLVLAERSFQ